MYGLMRQLARQGTGIIMISSELDEILGMSDRVLVMCRGRLAGEFTRAQVTEEKILTLAIGETL
jgi:ABC-type sugar transport system ATPase subunit